MLTDDDLTRELGAVFREQAAGLTYTGRRRPRRPSVTALPAAAAVAVLGAGLGVALHSSPSAVTARPGAGLSSPSTVSATINLDGLVLHYAKSAGAPDPLRVELDIRGLPSGARPVSLSGTSAKAWVGTDPATGDNALYVRSAARNGGRLFAVISPSWTQEQLIALLSSCTTGDGLRDGSPAGR